MIRMKPEAVRNLDYTLGGLKKSLQQAIELEHATIPAYLYALYSLQPGANKVIQSLVLSVVTEEMLHMSLACNVLNAIGGSPLIDDPKFIPTYPGPLPGSVESGLIVPLSPFSMDLVSNVFMVIEEPEDPLEFPVIKAEALMAAPPPLTIGQFYDGIKKHIIKLGNSIFTGDPRKQLTAGFSDLIQVTDVDSAVAAINLIVAQGEGTKTSPMDPEHEPAHFYRYEEITKGRKLIPNPDPKVGAPPYVYGGEPIPFDATKVWPTITNPKASKYAPGSKAFKVNNTFNYTYTSVLKCLHLVFNGQPDRIAPAIGLMESLKEQAWYLMSIEVEKGATAGPSFQYKPVSP
jgi:hypothetical protein